MVIINKDLEFGVDIYVHADVSIAECEAGWRRPFKTSCSKKKKHEIKIVYDNILSFRRTNHVSSTCIYVVWSTVTQLAIASTHYIILWS